MYRNDHDEFMAKMKCQDEERIEFLSATRAQRTPIELYALWLYTWSKQGGEIKHRYNYPYIQPAYVAPSDARAGSISFGGATFHGTSATAGQNVFDQPLDYMSNAWNRWMPTTGGARIPAGYGAGSMKLLILPDFVDVPITPATGDHREGREWGHTEVLMLKRAGSKLVATTNDSVATYPDVDALLENHSRMRQLEAEFLRRAGGKPHSQPVSSTLTSKLKNLFSRANPNEDRPPEITS